MLTFYRDRGYLSSVEYRRKVLSLMYQVARRALVRAVRRDLTGALVTPGSWPKPRLNISRSPDPQEGGRYQA